LIPRLQDYRRPKSVYDFRYLAAMRAKKRRTDNWWMGKVRSRDVGASLRLVPYWERGMEKSGRIEVIVDPGAAFGGGDHPTTIMALELIEQAVKAVPSAEPSMLDVGTGTGVLAVAGQLLGMGFAVAHDIDPAAVFTARRNLQLNGLSLSKTGADKGIHLFVGGVEAVAARFDIVAANLAAPLLLRLVEPLTCRVGRFLVLSGISDAFAGEVLRSYSNVLRLISHIRLDEWNAAWFETPSM
jgi:ribosomal protein L11 methyltransferase